MGRPHVDHRPDEGRDAAQGQLAEADIHGDAGQGHQAGDTHAGPIVEIAARREGADQPQERKGRTRPGQIRGIETHEHAVMPVVGRAVAANGVKLGEPAGKEITEAVVVSQEQALAGEVFTQQAGGYLR